MIMPSESFVDAEAAAAKPPPSRDLIHDPDDLDPAVFLQTVRELSERREKEDSARYRALEQEVEQGRAERAARRAGEFHPGHHAGGLVFTSGAFTEHLFDLHVLQNAHDPFRLRKLNLRELRRD